MLTVGVDLAAADERTALAAIAWSPCGAELRTLELGVSDERIVAAVTECDKAGIDCALGWPEPFTRMLIAHRDGHLHELPPTGAGSAWRRTMVYRTTDETVRALFPGLIPLSVSADRLAHAAMRCAAILAMLAASGVDVDRSGAGHIVEAYPSASLLRWGLPHRGYKGKAEMPVEALPSWLDLGPHAPLMRASHDAFDAVIAALTARAAALGLATTPDPDQRAVARIEGWIAVPTAPLTALVDSPASDG
ncbi:DUF429 domain-containing protein [Dactylosporangium matsuzakiense]|uniref:DUF429 domain-containing protein n=1 Tax=Dactylosporangium matsuzakiense TaxID=53360 RepID=A0A9W6NJ55_9ACTN|nr:DUF429 domain-containing protein [Dactylosporangium matsuzakiense]UWZ45332.1 DUF429 domain-containing protein [Dactylosporangium matsuzakiense]GLK98690.1 hypothetical protein GCM10017581_004310 [Dactylosporangium matsuzakiense]